MISFAKFISIFTTILLTRRFYFLVDFVTLLFIYNILRKDFINILFAKYIKKKKTYR